MKQEAMMKKISQQAEDKLLQALEKTAVLVNDGTDPSEAIAKVASEDGIPPGNINLMVHAYNTGRTTRQRMDNHDPMTKSADFPLADAAKVLELMYPTQVKTAAQQQRAVAISTEYAIPPTGILQRREKRAIRSRKVDWSMGVGPPEDYPHDPREQMRRAYAESERYQRKMAEARRIMREAFDKMAETFTELTDYFRRPGAVPIPVVTEQVSILHGGKGEQVMDQLVRVTPGLMKLSQHRCADRKPGLEDATGEPYALISQLLDELDDYKTKRAAYQSAHNTAVERSEALLRPFVQPRIQSVLEEPPSSTGSEKQAGSIMAPLMAGSLLTNIIRNARPGPNSLPQQVQNEWSSMTAGPSTGAIGADLDALTDPEHEQRLRAIRAQAMLQDLMVNDPSISGHDPSEVTEAFNEIIQVAPRAADKRVVMQGLLRKRLEQGVLAPFEVSDMLNIEDKQRKLTAPLDLTTPGATP